MINPSPEELVLLQVSQGDSTTLNTKDAVKVHVQ